jgi:peptidoglycan/LPS O-acetylase OafA/YrhL
VFVFLFSLFPAYHYMDMYLIARWAPLFVLGALLAIFREPLCRSILNLSKTARVALSAVGILLYSSKYSLPTFDFGNLFPIYLIGAGASIILLMTISDGRLQIAFRSHSAQLLGNVSYSFYLVHLPILIAVTSVVFPLTNSIVLSCAVSLGFSFLCAALIYKWIELPFQRIGKALSGISNNLWRQLYAPK